MTRRDIEFDAEGVTLRGWFYPAEAGGAPGAAVVMAHGFSAVKEMYLDAFAEVFAAGGLNVVVFDNRCFGASDGEPRQEIDAWAPSAASPRPWSPWSTRIHWRPRRCRRRTRGSGSAGPAEPGPRPGATR